MCVRMRTDTRDFRSYILLKQQIIKATHMSLSKSDPIKIIFSVLFPPIGVFMEVGLSKQFWINVLLTLLGFIPGIIHALYVINRYEGQAI